MNPMEYAAGDDPVYGPNPLQARGLFPAQWGEPPASPEALQRWIADNSLHDGARKGHPASVRALLERRRMDPSAVREEARARAANRMRRERLLQLRRDCP